MKIFSQSITADIAINWGKSKNSKKWLSLVESNFKDKTGKYLREAAGKVGGFQYYFYVFEKAAFAVKEASSTSGQVTHFGFGDFKGSKGLRWKQDGDKMVGSGKFTLDSIKNVKRVKDLLGESNPPPVTLSNISDGLIAQKGDLELIVKDEAVVSAVSDFNRARKSVWFTYLDSKETTETASELSKNSSPVAVSNETEWSWVSSKLGVVLIGVSKTRAFLYSTYEL